MLRVALAFLVLTAVFTLLIAACGADLGEAAQVAAMATSILLSVAAHFAD